jgi:hypothetical protein
MVSFDCKVVGSTDLASSLLFLFDSIFSFLLLILILQDFLLETSEFLSIEFLIDPFELSLLILFGELLS